MAQTRRTVLATTTGMFGLAGCLTNEGGGGFEEESDNTGDEDQFEDLSDTERGFAERLADYRTVESAASDGSELLIEIQTGSDMPEDRRTVAEVFFNFVRQEQLNTDLRTHIVDRGLRQATFRIELAWAQQFADGEIDDDEYLELIADTQDS